jgi:hypothetical protein
MRTTRRIVLKSFVLATLHVGRAYSMSKNGESMDPKNFWALVTTAKSAAGIDIDSRPVILAKQLSLLPAASIQAFQHNYEGLLLNANRWSLWGAAYLMNGGCSDDGFKYFRDWLISEGQEIYERAIADPDSLASFQKRDYFELESYGYAAVQAYERLGTGELARDFNVELAAPTGTEWNEEDLPKLFPKLAAKYL